MLVPGASGLPLTVASARSSFLTGERREMGRLWALLCPQAHPTSPPQTPRGSSSSPFPAQAPRPEPPLHAPRLQPMTALSQPPSPLLNLSDPSTPAPSTPHPPHSQPGVYRRPVPLPTPHGKGGGGTATAHPGSGWTPATWGPGPWAASARAAPGPRRPPSAPHRWVPGGAAGAPAGWVSLSGPSPWEETGEGGVTQGQAEKPLSLSHFCPIGQKRPSLPGATHSH